MAIVLTSSNLNTYGNNGQFETDPSTWGFAALAGMTMARDSAQQTSGLYSARFNPTADFSIGWMAMAKGKAPSIVIGGQYLLRAKVRVNGSNVFGSADCFFSFENPIIGFLTGEITKTIADANNTWVDIEGRFVAGILSGPSTEFVLAINQPDPGDSLNIGGDCWVDQFEIYSYIETEDPEPEPEPVPDTVYFSKNPITLGKTASPGWEVINNFRLYDDIRVEDVTASGTYNSKLKVALYPEPGGSVVFYARQAFRNVLQCIAPTLNHNEIVRLTDRIKFFKHYTGEMQNDQTEPVSTEASLDMIVMWGGVSKRKFPDLNFFTDYLPTRKKFLTWAPVVKNVDRLQEDFLNFWIYNDEIAELQLQIKAYFDDDTNETGVTKTLAGVLYGQLFQIPAGPVNSGANLVNPAKNLIKYELSLLNQDDELISEVRTYKINQVKNPLSRYIMILNSLGAYEVLCFNGQAETQTDVQREIVQKFLPHNYASTDGELDTHLATMQEKKNISTGFFKDKYAEQWLAYMREVLISPKLYDVTNGERVRVIITNTSLPGQADQNYVRFARFDIVDPYQDESYTPDDVNTDAEV